MSIIIYNDDCLKVLEKLKENSIDMILVDLPYGQTNCKWDCVIDLDKMWKLLKRCCKGNAVMVFFCTTKFGNTLINSNKKGFKYDLVWEKSRKVGFLSANRMPLRKHEMIYVFKGDKPHHSYNPQKTTGHKPGFHKADKIKEVGIYGKTEVPRIVWDDTRHPTSILHFEEEPTHEMVYVFKGDKPHPTYNPQKTTGHKSYFIKGNKREECVYRIEKTPDCYTDDTRHPTTILKFNNDNQGGDTLHRTQKPVDLCEWLIRSFSNEGEVVCDFTMGSGTTGIACLNTNRKFIGVELDEKIFKIAKDRIDNHKKKEVKEEVKNEGVKCSCGKVLKKITKRHLESEYHKKKTLIRGHEMENR
jgi:site-specific DNA-methyltransferase (adenine-specific)